MWWFTAFICGMLVGHWKVSQVWKVRDVSPVPKSSTITDLFRWIKRRKKNLGFLFPEFGCHGTPLMAGEKAWLPHFIFSSPSLKYLGINKSGVDPKVNAKHTNERMSSPPTQIYTFTHIQIVVGLNLVSTLPYGLKTGCFIANDGKPLN